MSGTEWDQEAIDRLNQRVETQAPTGDREFDVEDLFPEPEELTETEDNEGWEDLNGLSRKDEAATRKPAYMEEIEGLARDNEGQEWGEEEIEGVGDLVAHLVGNGKDFLNKVSKQKIRQKVREHFTEKQIPLIELVVFLEMEGKMNSTNAEVMKDWAAKYNTSIPELITVYVRYRELKEDLEVGRYEEWQRDGIKQHTISVLRKYVKGQVPPELMLGLYLVATIGWDAAKLGWYFWQEKRERNESK